MQPALQIALMDVGARLLDVASSPFFLLWDLLLDAPLASMGPSMAVGGEKGRRGGRRKAAIPQPEALCASPAAS